MKKSIKYGIGAGVLVLLAGAGIASQQPQKTETKPTETAKKEASQADKDSYEKALTALKTAEESLSDTDYATAEKLVKKAAYKKDVLKGKLNSLKISLPWRELKSLIAAAQTNPTDEAIAAAHKKLDELTADEVAGKSNKKADYTKQVYALYLKKVEAAVVQAENTTTADDVNNAINIWTATDPYPSNWGKSGFDSDLYSYINGLRSVLSARISAIQVGSKVAPVSQEQQQVQAAAQEVQEQPVEQAQAQSVEQATQDESQAQTYAQEYAQESEPEYVQDATPSYTGGQAETRPQYDNIGNGLSNEQQWENARKRAEEDQARFPDFTIKADPLFQ